MGKKKKKSQSTSPSTQPAPPPQDYLSTVVLSTIAFFSGCLVMVIELTSSRLLAPYWGNTIYCWTGVIGTILFALSLGYLVGGILADRYDKNRLLIALLSISCVAVASIPFAASLLSASFSTYDSIVLGPVFGSLLVFAFPAFALSTIPPLCVKIISQNFHLVGLASGLVSSISALGSIIGTFLTGFYLIPTFNLSSIYYISSLTLVLLLAIVIVLHKRLSKVEVAFVAIVLSLSSILVWEVYRRVEVFPDTNQVYQQLTPYHLIRVYDEIDHYKLTLDNTPEGAIAKGGQELVFEYTKYWELVNCFLGDDKLRRACFIGGGAFAMPIMLHRDFDQCRVDVVEIDPALVPVGYEFFHLRQSPNLRVHIDDGRRWFRNQEQKYDFVFLDAFHGVKNIPAHLVTREYFGELKRALSDHGVLALNLISTRQEGSFYQALVATLQVHFDKVFVFATGQKRAKGASNLILYCLKKGESHDRERIRRRAKNHKITHLADNLQEVIVGDDDHSQSIVFSDEYAPVEYMVANEP